MYHYCIERTDRICSRKGSATQVTPSSGMGAARSKQSPSAHTRFDPSPAHNATVSATSAHSANISDTTRANHGQHGHPARCPDLQPQRETRRYLRGGKNGPKHGSCGDGRQPEKGTAVLKRQPLEEAPGGNTTNKRGASDEGAEEELSGCETNSAHRQGLQCSKKVLQLAVACRKRLLVYRSACRVCPDSL